MAASLLALVALVGAGVLLLSRDDDDSRDAAAPSAAPTTSSPRRTPTAAPSPRLTRAPSPTPTPTAAPADARAAARSLDGLLTRSAASKGEVGPASQRLTSCQIPPAEALRVFEDAARGRRALLAELRALDLAALPEGQQLADSLAGALQGSAEADDAFAAWARGQLDGCRPDADDPDLQRGLQLSATAARPAKQRFTALWNPVAARSGLPARDPRQPVNSWRPAAVMVLAALVGCAGPGASPQTAPSDAPTTSAPPTSAPATAPPTLTPAARATYAFPVAGCEVSYGRAHHDYPATDVFADEGCAVVAVTAGRVDEVSRVDRWDPVTNRGADRGGLSVSVEGDDGVRYYVSHLSRLAPGTAPGLRVTTGQRLGEVGRTGSARKTPPHTHVGLSWPTPPGTWWVRRGAVEPADWLDAWRAGRDASPASAVATERRRTGTVPPEPRG